MSWAPKHGECRATPGGTERWDKPSRAWVTAEEWMRRKWAREDQAFARRGNQGALCCPMIIRDGMAPVQSQVDGRMYDSKSQIRRHYRESGVIEVGTEPIRGRYWGGAKPEDPHVKARRREAAGRALAAADIAIGDVIAPETIRVDPEKAEARRRRDAARETLKDSG